VKGDFVVVGVGKILDGYGKLPSRPHLVGKSTFNCLVGVKESHMVKLAHGLKVHGILLWDQLATRNNFLTMMEFCYNIKKQRVIKNEIMVFHRHPQLTSQYPQPYIMEMWKKMKLQHKYSKVLFVLLKKKVSNDFFKGKIHMNLSKDPPFDEFNKVLEQWISRSIDGNPQIGRMRLELHYRVDPLEFDSLKDIVDEFSRNVNVQSNKSRRIFVVSVTMNSLSEDPNIYFQTNWKNILLNLLSMKVAFKTIVCICDQKSFNNLIITLHEEGFMDDISMEYGFYQASKHEVLLSRSLCSWMNLPLLICVYLFPS
jgi:hypothetical protein